MEYRDIGKTGMKAGVVGLGTEHLDGKPYAQVKEVIDAALEADINILDLFMPGAEVRSNIGKALKGRRDQVLIQGHLGSVDVNRQYDISRDLELCKRYFEDLLRYLQTDYIDLGMLFYMDSLEDWQTVRDNGLLAYAQDLKQQGVIRALGASSHHPEVAAEVVNSGVIDLLMFSVNPAFDLMSGQFDLMEMLGDSFKDQVTGIDPTRAELYRLCERKNVAITTMKTLGSGKLLSAEQTPFAGPMSVVQCIHYALTRPAVVSTLIGCESRAQVQEAIAYLNATPEERDYAPVMGSVRRDFRGSCVYCSHCLPCPSEIDIAAVNRCLDQARLNEADITQDVRTRYQNLSAHGSDCIACGSCEAKCPFGVPVIDNMKAAAALFGK